MIFLFFFFALCLLTRTYILRAEYAWYTLAHSLFTFWGLALLYLFGTWDLLECSVGGLLPQFEYYYQAQLAFRWISLVFLLCMDTDNGTDMFVHHLFTNTVLVLSTSFNFERVGFVVLLLHDVSDVFLYAARHFRREHGEDSWNARGNFALFVLTFVALRMGALPYYVVTQCLPVASKGEEWLALGLLGGLVLLHYYWFVAILKIVMKLWRKCRRAKQS